MATASATRLMLWTDLEGREVMGRWRLVRLVRPEGRTAWFEAAGIDGTPVMVSLTEALNDEEDLLARLRAAAEIRHPNVAAVWEAHQTLMDETPVVLAAMEPTDENLADVLRERALDATEALPLMDALLKGLAAIHARQLLHGRMEASSVLAMGDTVKLRSDCVQLAGAASAARAAEDVRGVGRIVTQALTRRIPANENDPVLQLLPEPLGRSVRRALSGNATVEEIAVLAGTRLAPMPAAVPRPALVEKLPAISAAREITLQPFQPAAVSPEAAAPKNETNQEKDREPSTAPTTQATLKPDNPLQLQGPVPAKAPEPLPAEGIRPPMAVRDAPAAPAAGSRQMELLLTPRLTTESAEDDAEEEDAGASSVRMWQWRFPQRSAPYVIAAAVVLIVATMWMLHGWLHRAPAPAPQRVIVVGKTNASPAVKTAPIAASGASSAAAERVWRVVVYTYRHRSQAEHKAQVIAQRYPQLHADVYATRGGAWLVTVGGAMTREEAYAERGRAVRLGMPRDTYAQNFR